MRMQGAVIFVTFGSLLLTSADARGNATVFPEGSYARPRTEAVIVTWDATSNVEHLDLAITFEGDATSLLYVVPTPTQPVVERPLRAVVDGAWSLTSKPAAPNPPLARVAVANIAFESQKFESTEALAKWIQDHGFASRPTVADWAEGYVRRGSVFNLIRVTEASAGRRELEVAPIRLSFKTETPFLPYAEPEPDFASHTAYLERSGVCKAGAPCAARQGQGQDWDRALDALVVAPSAVRLTNPRPDSMSLNQALEVAAASLPALGSASFPFDAKRQPRWTLTRFADLSNAHAGSDDLQFEPVAGAWSTASPARHVRRSAGSASSHRDTRTRKDRSRVLFVALTIGLAIAASLVLRDAESKA